MKLEDEIMLYWQKGVKILEKQANCDQEAVMWDATGKVGICVMCGKTIKRG